MDKRWARSASRQRALAFPGGVAVHPSVLGGLHVQVVLRGVGALHPHAGELDVLEYVQSRCTRTAEAGFVD